MGKQLLLHVCSKHPLSWPTPETVADSDDLPLKDLPAQATTPTAGPDGASPPITESVHSTRQFNTTPTPNIAAPKRTAAGKYKQRPVVYSECGDSDTWSDHDLSDSEENYRKRPRTDAIVTRSRSVRSETSNPSDISPPDVSTPL